MFTRTITTLAVLLLLAPATFAQTVHAVLLDDLNIVEGKVEKIDGFVRITPATGPAKLVLAKQIEFLGETRDAVYDFVRQKADTTSADGLVKLASWCEKNNMIDRAKSHAASAAAISPESVAIRQMVTRLAQVKEKAPPVPPASSALTANAPILSSDSSVYFNTKVHAVLLNKCASCHAQKNHAGTFKLVRVAEGYANPEATAENLRVTASHLKAENPAESALLLYSLAAHGGQKVPAFASRELPSFQNLEQWVRISLPAKKAEPLMGRQDVIVAAATEPAQLPGTVVSGQPLKVAASPPVVVAPTAPPEPPKVGQQPTPSSDPFDPKKFNSLPPKK